ncbi:MAG: bifunctional diaminohydroxyphosphoribosylaminopyrimidine deaminase/5-amino-6-(5-phosphoribosylamino)uracil reductase RibD [Planctomycetaceae bacterium]
MQPTERVSAAEVAAMRRALEIARRGEGRVEPNPMVAAVVLGADGSVVAEGWHDRFGGPHAEAMALAAAGDRARGATLVVTLEPCCHHGKTPPCADAIVAAGIARVVVAAGDPFPAVAGGGIATLRAAGIDVETGLLEAEARRLTAPFRKLVTTGTPWVIAKWAVTRDGRVALPPGGDRWISSPESRALVHALRARVDAIAVGSGTVLADDPLLTARPEPGAVTETALRPLVRIVLDGRARLPVSSRLVRTARESPVLVAVGPDAPTDRIAALRAAGCEVWRSPAAAPAGRLRDLLAELGRRQLTNLLVEGGPQVFRTLFNAGLADETWAFVAPREAGGVPDPSATLPPPPPVDVVEVGHPGGDTLTRGLVRRAAG